jgi:hypothetical protein
VLWQKTSASLPQAFAPCNGGGYALQATVCNLALKLGLRDKEIQFAEFTDISWHESVFRVRGKLKYKFRVKDYEERDIPIPLDFL